MTYVMRCVSNEKSNFTKDELFFKLSFLQEVFQPNLKLIEIDNASITRFLYTVGT